MLEETVATGSFGAMLYLGENGGISFRSKRLTRVASSVVSVKCLNIGFWSIVG
jgi:hypothetical protein